MAEVSIDGHACLKTMCFTGFDFRDGFAGLGYPMNVTELYWLQVNIGLGNGLCRQAKSYISAAYADRQSSFCLAIQYTRRFCAQGDSMPHRCLATGRWGAARGRPDTGMARDPAPCPLPGVMKNRQVDMTKIKSLLHKRQTSLYTGHEW